MNPVAASVDPRSLLLAAETRWIQRGRAPTKARQNHGRTELWIGTSKAGHGGMILSCYDSVLLENARGLRTCWSMAVQKRQAFHNLCTTISQNLRVLGGFWRTQFNRRDAMSAEKIPFRISAFIASLRFHGASALVAALLLCAHRASAVFLALRFWLRSRSATSLPRL
jgi:hypothetical protein